MRAKWFLRFTVLMLVMLVPGIIFAGTTGKIAGYCKDAETGEPLPAVNIVIEGTTMGASSDVNGYYVILNVPVGVYTLKASMMGYKEVTVEDVKVTVDITSWQNFDMEPTVIIGETVTVTAERPLIEPDVTMSRTLYETGAFENISATSISRVMELTAGYVRGSFRGGRTYALQEVVTYVDGISLHNPIGSGRVSGTTGEGTVSLATRLSPLGIEEMEVITGGFNAEYGNAQSGVVNIITKEGGRRHTGEIRYTFDLPALGYILPFLGEDIGKIKLTAPKKAYRWIEDDPFRKNMFQGWYTNQYVQWSMGGILFENLFNLVPGTFYYHVSGEYGMYTIPYWAPDFSKKPFDRNNNAYFHDSKPDQWAYSVNAKITFRPSASLKFTLHGLKSRRLDLPWVGAPIVSSGEYIFGTRYDLIAGEIDSGRVKVPKLCLPEGDMDPLTIPDSVAVKNFDFSVNGATHVYWSNQLALSVTHTLSAKAFYNVSLSYFETMHDEIARDPATGQVLDYYDGSWQGRDAPRFKMNALPIGPGMPSVNPNSAYMHRGGETHRQKTWTLKGDLTSQVTDKHQVKAGFEGRAYDLRMRDFGIASGGNDYNDKYHRKPWYLAAYVQDKMELLGMIVNAGYRMDVISVESWYPKDYLDPLTGRVYPDGTREIKNPVKTKPDFTFSPRLGISFPIRAGDVLHFTYGHYFQFPPYDRYLTNTNYDLRGAFHYIGNPNLKPERTVSYEFGVEHQILEDLGIDITGFYKDITDLIDTQEIIDNRGLNIYYYKNFDYANVKGVEFTLTKRYKYNFSAQLSYTLQWAYARTNSVTQSFSDLWSVRTPRTKMYRADYDQRHTINLNLDYRVPEGWGPTIWGKKLLDDWGVNLLYRAGSGTPFSSRAITIVPPINDDQYPWWHQIDIRVNKDVKVLPWMKLSFFAQVFNLFNWYRIMGTGAMGVEWYQAVRDGIPGKALYWTKPKHMGGKYVDWVTGREVDPKTGEQGRQVHEPHKGVKWAVESPLGGSPGSKGSARRIQVGVSIKFM